MAGASMLGVHPTADMPMTAPTPPHSGPPAPRCDSCGPWWRLPLLLALVLAAMLLARSLSGPEAVTAPEAPQPAHGGSSGGQADSPPTDGTVSLSIDFGNGRTRRYDELAWHDGMTAAELLAAARLAGSRAPSAVADGRTPPQQAGHVTFVQQGSGASAFLTEIDGVAGEGRAGRNWVFSVNDRRADRGFAAYVLRPGDRVLWRFVPTR